MAKFSGNLIESSFLLGVRMSAQINKFELTSEQEEILVGLFREQFNFPKKRKPRTAAAKKPVTIVEEVSVVPETVTVSGEHHIESESETTVEKPKKTRKPRAAAKKPVEVDHHEEDSDDTASVNTREIEPVYTLQHIEDQDHLETDLSALNSDDDEDM